MTYQQLLWAIRGKQETEWDHTAAITYTIASVVNFSGRRVDYSTFHPFMKVKKVRPSDIKEKIVSHVPKSKRRG